MYNGFALVYDKLMEDAETEKRAEKIYSLFEEFDKAPTLMLDLACGTGEFAREFTRRGVSVIGVDISEDMLSVASEKNSDNEILYLNQDMLELDLYGTVDGAICTLDSLNHLDCTASFEKAIKNVSLFLEKDRLFIFDLNTPFKHKNILSNNTFVKENEDVFCVWQNEYNDEDMSVQILLDIFLKAEDGAYDRFSESFREIAFEESTVKRVTEKAGLEILKIIDGDTYENVTETTERALYITKKVI